MAVGQSFPRRKTLLLHSRFDKDYLRRPRGAIGRCELTTGVRDAVQVMLTELQRPDLLDEDWLAPWRAAT